MPWYRVTYGPLVIDDLRAAESGMAQRLLDKTKWIASNAANLRHDPLHQDLPGIVQYAVGEWRILYSIDREEHLVHIHRITTRKEVYRKHSASSKA